MSAIAYDREAGVRVDSERSEGGIARPSRRRHSTRCPCGYWSKSMVVIVRARTPLPLLIGSGTETSLTSSSCGIGRMAFFANTKISLLLPRLWRVASKLRTSDTLKRSIPPRDFSCHGLELQGITEAIRTGLDRVPSVKIQLVADLTRDLGPQEGDTTLTKVNEVRSSGVIGIGLGGREAEFPPEPFAEVFERAREHGV